MNDVDELNDSVQYANVIPKLYEEFLLETNGVLEEGILDKAKQFFNWLFAKMKMWLSKGFEFFLEKLGITDAPIVNVHIDDKGLEQFVMSL